MLNHSSHKQHGSLAVTSIIFVSLAAIMMAGLGGWMITTLKNIDRQIDREQALGIAESGAEYYRWALNHDPNVDLNDQSFEFFRKDGVRSGEFYIQEGASPQSNLRIAFIWGILYGEPDVIRSIEVRFSRPSFASAAVISSADIEFTPGVDVLGAVHSNGGIRFDGFASGQVSSSQYEYDDPSHSGNLEYGVHTHVTPVDPFPPDDLPDRFDVFAGGRALPTPAVDFTGISSALSDIKAQAQNDGYYFGPSGKFGYHVVLKDNDSFDLYQVKKIKGTGHWSCQDTTGDPDWGTWSIQVEHLIDNYELFTNNHVAFFEDDVWVSGEIDGLAMSIGAGRFPDTPGTRANIILTEDLTYTNYDGTDRIGLIAQNNINIGMISDTNLRVDAALLAEHGRVGRHYYPDDSGPGSGCNPYDTRNSFENYGSIGTAAPYGFAWSDGNGYQTRILNYDGNLLFNPPPMYPLADDSFNLVFWREHFKPYPVACMWCTPTDTEPPSIPQNLVAVPFNPTKMDLSWDASTDNVEVIGYQIIRDGLFLDTTDQLTFRDNNLSPKTEYCYKIRAYDLVGNLSDPSPEECVETPPDN